MRSITYHGSEDITTWLQRHNEGDPVLLPEWPAPSGRVVLCLQWMGNDDDDTLLLWLPKNCVDAIANNETGMLWFCTFPVDVLRRNTDVPEEVLTAIKDC